MGVYEKVTKIVQVIRSDKATASDRLILCGGLGTVVFSEIAMAASADGTDESRAKVRADVDRVVTEYLTPVDLPAVPNYFEPFVDMALAAAVRGAVDAIFDKSAEARARLAEVLKAA